MSREFVEQVSGHCASLRSVAADLQSLSYSFEHTGNERMSDTMGDLARSVRTIAEALGKDYDAHLTGEHQQAMAGMAGILVACLNRDEADAKRARQT